MTATEQLQRVRSQLSEARNALDAAERTFDADASVLHAARVATLERYEADLMPQEYAEREAEATTAARQRLRGMRSAMGSHLASLAKDEQAVRDAAQVLTGAIEKLNGRFRDVEKLHAEAEALTDRFGLTDEAPLRIGGEPAYSINLDLPGLAKLSNRAPVVEQHPDVPTYRRRTYAEVEGTKAGEIISSIGLKPWPAIPAQIANAIEHQRQQADRNIGVLDGAVAAIPPSSSFSLANQV
jgi:hypothetical protein